MKCQFIKQNKEQCRMNAISSDVFCFTHSARTTEAKRQAVIKGGKAPKPRLNEHLLPYMALTTKDSYVALLEQTIKQLRTSPMTYQKAQSISNLFNTLQKIEEQTEQHQVEEGLFDILKKGLGIESRINEKTELEFSNEDYLKIIEETINGLRRVNMTARNAQSIAQLVARGFDVLNKVNRKPSILMSILIEQNNKDKATASVVQ